MKTIPLRSIDSAGVEPAEVDFPLPVADPSVRPMHRQCVLTGCTYRSRFVSHAGWVLAALFLMATLVTGLYRVGSEEALQKENSLLYEQIEVLRRQSIARPPVSVPVPVEKIEASESPAPPAAPATPRSRVTAPTARPKELPPVPESEKWWNRS